MEHIQSHEFHSVSDSDIISYSVSGSLFEHGYVADI